MVEWLILSTFASSRKKQQQKLLSKACLLILKLLEIKVAERHSHISSLAIARAFSLLSLSLSYTRSAARVLTWGERCIVGLKALALLFLRLQSKKDFLSLEFCPA